MPGERFIVGEDAVTTSREELDFGQSCQDINGRIVAGGNHYVPGPDSCTVCLCDEGKPKWCQAVLCAAPKDCKSFRIGSSCCEFICLDDEPGESGDSSIVWDKDLGLRLLATTVTALLSLALLAFLLHRVLKKSRWSSQRRNRSACNEDEADGGPTSSLASYEHHGDLTSSVGHLSRQPAQMMLTNGDVGQPIYLLWKEPDERHSSENPPPPYSETDGPLNNNGQQSFLNDQEESTGLLDVIPSAPPQPEISEISLRMNSEGVGNRLSSAVSMTTVVLVRRSNGTLDSELLDAGTPPPSYAEVLASGISNSALDQDLLHNNPLQGGSEERQSTLSLPVAQRGGAASSSTGPASAIHRFSLQLSLMDMESTEEDEEEEEDSLSGFSTSSSSSSSSASTAHPI